MARSISHIGPFPSSIFPNPKEFSSHPNHYLHAIPATGNFKHLCLSSYPCFLLIIRYYLLGFI